MNALQRSGPFGQRLQSDRRTNRKIWQKNWKWKNEKQSEIINWKWFYNKTERKNKHFVAEKNKRAQKENQKAGLKSYAYNNKKRENKRCQIKDRSINEKGYVKNYLSMVGLEKEKNRYPVT